MIKKQSIFYGLMFLILTSMGQQAHAMKWTKHQWANGFRLGMKALNYAGAIGLPAYIAKKSHDELEYLTKNAIKLDPDSKNYILNTIYNAYPELQNNPVEVVRFQGLSFATMKFRDKHYLLVPYDETELKKAIHYKKTGTHRHHNELTQRLADIWQKTVPQFIVTQEIEGRAMTPTTFDVWKGSLLHEGSHILHNDHSKQILLSLTTPLAIIYGTAKVKRALNLSAFLSSKPTIQNIAKGLGYIPSLPLKLIASTLLGLPYAYWSEYRADQDEIKRAQNLSILKAETSAYQNIPEQNPLELSAKIRYFLDPHPAYKTRASYFAKAAQKLENEQELTRQALAYYMSGDDVPTKD